MRYWLVFSAASLLLMACPDAQPGDPAASGSGEARPARATLAVVTPVLPTWVARPTGSATPTEVSAPEETSAISSGKWSP
jgi:hypothetical protein